MKFLVEIMGYRRRKFLCIMLCCLFTGIIAMAQDTVHVDTADYEEMNEDSAYQSVATIADSLRLLRFVSNPGLQDTLKMRQIPFQAIDSLKKQDAFWYADEVFEKKEPKQREFKFRKPPAQWMNTTMLVIIVALFLGVLIWYLFQNNIISTRKNIAIKKSTVEISEKNIFEIEYEPEINLAIQNGDYRLATRLMFLRLLRNLSQKKIIQYKHDRTNFEYLSQLYKTNYYHDFFRITRNYEYAWYGKFDVSTETFGIIKNEFENFDRKLS